MYIYIYTYGLRKINLTTLIQKATYCDNNYYDI